MVRAQYHKNAIACLFCLALVLLTSTWVLASPKPSVVRIGVLAKRGEVTALKRWSATATYLCEKIPNFSFIIIPLGFDQIYPAVANNDIDFVLANSAYYAGLERKYGVKAIVTMENSRLGESLTEFGGVIFCRADRSDLNGHADFKGKSFMAADQKSFGGYYMAWFHLLQHGFDPHKSFKSVEFAGTHDGVVEAVLNGDVDIGTVRSDTLERMMSEGLIDIKDFRVFIHDVSETKNFPFMVTTNLYPEWPIAQLKDVDEDLVRRVTIALMGMSAESQAALDAHINGWTTPHDYLPVHECLMGLRVEPYTELNEMSIWDVIKRYGYIGVMFIIVLGLVSVFTVSLNRTKKKLEWELQQNQEAEKKLTRFKTILEQIYDCVFIFDPDSLRFSYVNQSAMKQVGYNLEELLSMTPLDIMMEYSKESFNTLLAPLKSGEVELLSFETGYWHKENYLVPVDVHLQYVSCGTDRPRFIAVVRDITEQKAEAKQFRRLFEASMDAIMVVGAEGFIDCNQQALEMFGFEHKKEFLCLHPADVSPPTQPSGVSSLDLARERINDAMEQKVALFEWIHQRKDGVCFPAEVMLSPFELDGEMVLHSVVRDVTERKRIEKDKDKLQAKLLHAQKLESVGQLAAGIAHEINTPTQYVANNITFLAEVIEDVQEIIRQFIQLIDLAKKNGSLTKEQITEAEELLEDVGWDELSTEIPEAIDQSKEGLKRVTSIVKAMKEFSHPGSKEKADTDLNQVITTTITVARNEWKYVADLDVKLFADLPLIPCLSDEIGQVILNMIVNAAHAIAERLGENSEGKGRILLQTSCDSESVEIMITDTGNGIPDTVLPRIFDPFFTTKKVGKGTGQGLAICHDVITQKHAGTLTCESRVGVGTTFTIRLPLVAS